MATKKKAAKHHRRSLAERVQDLEDALMQLQDAIATCCEQTATDKRLERFWATMNAIMTGGLAHGSQEEAVREIAFEVAEAWHGPRPTLPEP